MSTDYLDLSTAQHERNQGIPRGPDNSKNETSNFFSPLGKCSLVAKLTVVQVLGYKY